MSLGILDDSLQFGTRGRCTCDKKHDPSKTNPNRFDKHNKKEGGNLTCYGIDCGPPRNARNSGPPLPSGRPMSEAKTVWLPSVENFRISPGAAAFSSATKRSPEGSKAIPLGSARSVANVLSIPSGAHTRIASPPGPPSFPS